MWPQGSFTPSASIPVTVRNVTLMGKIGMQPILPITVPVKKIKGATRQCFGDGDGVIRCEQAFQLVRPDGQTQNLTCPNENQIAKQIFPTQSTFKISYNWENILIFLIIFWKFNLSIWVSQLKINLSGMEAKSTRHGRANSGQVFKIFTVTHTMWHHR